MLSLKSVRPQILDSCSVRNRFRFREILRIVASINVFHIRSGKNAIARYSIASKLMSDPSFVNLGKLLQFSNSETFIKTEIA